MKYIEHLKILTNRFKKNVETETSIAQLTNLLCCSDRHVKTIVAYLHDEQFIKWHTQQGRGKKPTITMQYSNEDVIFLQAKHLVEKGHYQSGFECAQSLGTIGQHKFQQWFEESLGLIEDKADKSIDLLRYPFYETRLNLDPLYIMSRHDAHIVQQVFDKLVEYDSTTDQLLPRIAYHWENINGQKWMFYLQKGVKFHNGRELTSEDVKNTFERFPENDPITKNIKRIETPSTYIVIFHLTEVNYLFPNSLSNNKFSIVPLEEIKDKEDSFKVHPIGTGPFLLARHDKEMIRLDVFDQYYRNRPWLDRVEIIKTPAAFHDGKKHPLLLRSPDDSWYEKSVNEEGSDYISINCRKKGPLMNKEVRQQLLSIIHPENFCLAQGNEVVAHSFLTTKSKELNMHNKIGMKREIVDLDFEIKIAVQQIRPGANHLREALILQKQMAAHNISSTIHIIDINDVSPSTFQEYDLFVGGAALGENKLLSALLAMQSTALNIRPFATDEMKRFIDERIIQIKQSNCTARQWEIYFKIEQYLTENCLILFLNHRSHKIYEPKNSLYQNIKLNENGRIDYRKVWKKYSIN